MTDKIEIQETISKQNYKTTDEEFLNILRLIAPGTNFRAALNGALKIGKGALVTVENSHLLSLIDGGFRINARFTPQRFMELTKMDGAIILSKDMKKINYANAMLAPDNRIKSNETGTRHKTAERTAKQTGNLTIAISERKNEITLYYKNVRYPILPTDDLIRKSNDYLQTIQKQRELFDKNIQTLTRVELRNQQTLSHAVSTIQKGVFAQKIAANMHRYILELGNEGTLIKTRLKELIEGVEKETDLVIKDYTNISLRRTKEVLENLSYENVLDKEEIIKALGYENSQKISAIKGWRILSKTSLSDAEIASLIKETGTLGAAIHSRSVLLNTFLGEEKTKLFDEEIRKIKMDYQ
ncbi:DNA integrity scanning diadenylate cyclase DisA [Candidatus Pacearchaeota archaeon]|nr:DNA integrity scanning diadenylate cyclase DisA [Candidatus Pacearchaeota archaeon]